MMYGVCHQTQIVIIYDKVFLWFLKCILKVKISTSNDIILGEFGAVPPSIQYHINVLTFYRRLAEMPGNTIIKQVFTALHNLHNQGFRTWVSKVREIAQQYGCGFDQPDLHTNDIKMTIKEKFMEGWRSRLRNSNRHPKLELYKELKSDFHFEPYVDLVTELKYRNALTKIRSSSHLLEIERGTQKLQNLTK